MEINITINGVEKKIDRGSISVYDLVTREEGIPVELVAIQLNGDIVAAELFENTKLKNGDKIEFAYFMGGG